MPQPLVENAPDLSIVNAAEKKLVKIVWIGDQEPSDFDGVFTPASLR